MYFDLDWQDCKINDEISCKIKPLEFGMYLQTKTFLESCGFSEKSELAFEDMEPEKLQELVKRVLPKSVKDLSGIEFKFNGEVKKATVEDLVQHDAFIILCVQIMARVFSISTIAGIEQPNEQVKEGQDKKKYDLNDSVRR